MATKVKGLSNTYNEAFENKVISAINSQLPLTVTQLDKNHGNGLGTSQEDKQAQSLDIAGVDARISSPLFNDVKYAAVRTARNNFFIRASRLIYNETIKQYVDELENEWTTMLSKRESQDLYICIDYWNTSEDNGDIYFVRKSDIINYLETSPTIETVNYLDRNIQYDVDNPLVDHSHVYNQEVIGMIIPWHEISHMAIMKLGYHGKTNTITVK
jgi:hypothetical protein